MLKEGYSTTVSNSKRLEALYMPINQELLNQMKEHPLVEYFTAVKTMRQLFMF